MRESCTYGSVRGARGNSRPYRDRREFITLLGGAAAAWPLAASAQQGKVYRLGILAIARALPRAWDELFRGLRDHGYVEGQNLIIERRYSEGQGERWPELASELVGLKVDAIAVGTTPAALAVKKATSTIPIIIAAAFDPVGAGLAASLARPGGNVTGLGLFIPEVSAKGLALLKEAVSSLTRVAVLWNAANPALALVWRDVEAIKVAPSPSMCSDTVDWNGRPIYPEAA